MEEHWRELLHGNSRMLVLSLLTRSEMHPYGIHKTLVEETHSHAVPSLGNLYPLLTSLQEEGLVTSRTTTGRGEQLRKVYRITPRGRRELRNLTATWRTFTTHVNKMLG